MGCYTQLPRGGHELTIVIALVGAERRSLFSPGSLQHRNGRLALCSGGRFRDGRIRRQTIPVVHQHVRQMAQLRICKTALFELARLWIRSGAEHVMQ